MPNPNTPYNITQLTQHIEMLLKRDALLGDVWVEGEITDFRGAAASGHLYLSLKDATSQIRCVMWKSSAAGLTVRLENGMKVRAHGAIGLYAQRGDYQLTLDTIQPAGLGDLYLQFERLKAKLAAEGLFNLDRKRPFPPYPRWIGVVTSPGAAAFQDVQNVLRRRYPLATVLLSPTLVQGAEAPPQIVRAIQALNAEGRSEVILLIRGGGSMEDLWSFNEEGVVRAVAESDIPIVTGVGHEVDFTLVDFAADLRAPTPSAAAEQATPDFSELRAYLKEVQFTLTEKMQSIRSERASDLQREQKSLQFRSPQRQIETLREHLDDLSDREGRAVHRHYERATDRLATQHKLLQAANPQRLLERGYAMINRAEDGKRVSRTADAPPGTRLTLTFSDGTRSALVEDSTEKGSTS